MLSKPRRRNLLVSEKLLQPAATQHDTGECSPSVTVILPCRNEEPWITKTLQSIIASDYETNLLEIIVIDGISTDNTRNLIAEFSERHVNVRMIDNPKKTTPHALNLGVRAARNDVIIRIDAHSEYPDDYVSNLIHWLTHTTADNVGGICITRAANASTLAKAIAKGLSSRFGVGTSYFRVGATKPMWVDTVPFGCFRKELFEKIGLFDEELIRNQDDEFNHRIIKNGGRILLVPDIRIDYYARSSIPKLSRMFFQYGFFKPIAASKVGGVKTIRQLVPSLFITSLVFTSCLSLALPAFVVFPLGIVAAYAAALTAGAISTCLSSGILCFLFMYLVFPTIHFSYGTGYILGLITLFRKGTSATIGKKEFSLSR